MVATSELNSTSRPLRLGSLVSLEGNYAQNILAEGHCGVRTGRVAPLAAFAALRHFSPPVAPA